MPIDDYRWFRALRALTETVSFEEAGAIMDVARFAAGADGQTSIDEVAVIVMLRRMITELAGGRVPDPAAAVDARGVEAIGNRLTATGSRELAYACAMIVMAHDLRLTTEERDVANDLAKALRIDPARARTISLEMQALVVEERHGRAIADVGATVSGTADTIVSGPADKPKRS